MDVMVHAIYIPYIYGMVHRMVYGMVLLGSFMLFVVTNYLLLVILMFYSRARHTNVCRFCS